MPPKNTRTCIACRERHDKAELLRIVLKGDKTLSIDKNHNIEGRGSYICNNPVCIKKAIKVRALNKTFKRDVGNDIYIQLEQLYQA